MLFSSGSLNFRNGGMLGLAVAAGLAAVGSIGLAPAQANITGLYGQWLTGPASSGAYANTAPNAGTGGYGTSGDALTLTSNSNTTWNATGGPGGSGYLQLESASGAPGYLTTNAVTNLDLTGSYTVSGWVNFNSYGNVGGLEIFNTRYGNVSINDNGTGGMDIQTVGNSTGLTGLHGDIGTSTGWLETSADAAYPFATGKWYMVTYAVTGDANGGNVVIYVNGASAATVDWTNPANTSYIPALLETGTNPSQFEIGASAGGVSAGVADFRIYNTQLSSDQVSSLYNSVIPEPATLGLMAVAGAGILLVKRRKPKQA